MKNLLNTERFPSFFPKKNQGSELYSTSFRIRFLGVLVGVMILSGCSRGNLYIDNSGSENLKIELDGQAFSLEAGAGMMIKSGSGQHRLRVMDENKALRKDTLFTLQKGGLINLAAKRYVKWNELYGDEKYRNDKLSSQKIEYESWIFTGDFTEYDSLRLFIEKDWDYDLDQPFPEGKIGWDLPNGEKYVIKSKIYRMEDFVKEVRKK